jgi:tRNA threonylcarbamoyladenosine biosynthesis protein TsaB
LNRHELKPCDIGCFAAALGPGSFTGVRVGLACIKGLAESCKKRAAGVSNLEALAWFGSAPLRAPVLDARRGEVYGAVYDSEGRLVAPEVVAPFGEWLKGLPDDHLELVFQDFTPFQSLLTGTRFEGVPVVTAPAALARAIARIAYARLLRGETQDPAALDANYVRRSDAELFWKE